MVWADSRSLAATEEVVFTFFSWGYLDVSVHPVRLHGPMYSDRDSAGLPALGFPIRTSPSQSLFAALRGLSQLTTSFIAYWRLGIHHVLLVA